MKKYIAIVATVVLFVGQATPVMAFEVPTAPPAPTAPPLPSDPGEIHTPPPTPAPPASTPTPPPMPTRQPTPVASASPAATSEPQAQASSTPAASGSTGQTTNGGSGGSVETGDATTTASIVNTGNNNAATVAEPTGSDGGAAIVENGAGSGSTIQESNTNSVVTNQANTATINNALQGASVTGDNSVSYSTGGDSKVKTGDANTTGTIINNVNTNLAGVTVSEFNIVDDHVGNVILDLAAGCISGCQSLPSDSSITANGMNSQNGVLVTDLTNSQTFQNNDADVTNSMVLAADTGDNLTSYNTGGDSTIQTGDANVAANILNFANNNIAGNVYYTVVNIFGDLIGNIILPESELAESQNSNTIASNGADTTNALQSTQTFNQETNQTNAATIENNLVFDANAGRNGSSYNTGGDSSIQTGDTTVEAQVTNVANANLNGGNWFLVIVNEAGNWVGRIMGLPGADGTTAANFDIAVDQNGNVIAGNGAGSTNALSQNTQTSSEITQSNTANIQNNVNLSANTGNNEASYNTNGDSSIQTGDATIIANIVNFVNTNITGGAKLFVTVINVFGSWKGNFGDTSAVADTSEPSNHSNSISQGNSSTSSNSSSSSSNTSVPTPSTVVLGIVKRSAKSVFGTATPSAQEAQGEVLGAQTQLAGKPSTTINLAWGLPIIVLLGGIYLLRRRLA